MDDQRSIATLITSTLASLAAVGTATILLAPAWWLWLLWLVWVALAAVTVAVVAASW